MPWHYSNSVWAVVLSYNIDCFEFYSQPHNISCLSTEIFPPRKWNVQHPMIVSFFSHHYIRLLLLLLLKSVVLITLGHYWIHHCWHLCNRELQRWWLTSPSTRAACRSVSDALSWKFPGILSGVSKSGRRRGGPAHLRTSPAARRHDNSREWWRLEERRRVEGGGERACGAETGVAGVCASPVRSFGRMGAELTPTPAHHSFSCFLLFGSSERRIWSVTPETIWTPPWCTTRAQSSPSSSRKVGSQSGKIRVEL